MLIKYLIDTDFVNYKKPSMLIGFPHCDFKCGKENCQNRHIPGDVEDVTVDIKDILKVYDDNKLTEAIVLAGMEPFDSPEDMCEFLLEFRNGRMDDIVIYTGYDKEEMSEEIFTFLDRLQNVIIKYGRYIPGDEPHYDETLGVNLASDNQYAERVNLFDIQ